MSVSDVVNLDKSCDVNLLIASMERSLGDKNMTADALNRKFSTESPLKPTKVLPFSSKRKLSAVTFSDGTTYALGAPDFVCKSPYTGNFRKDKILYGMRKTRSYARKNG